MQSESENTNKKLLELALVAHKALDELGEYHSRRINPALEKQKGFIEILNKIHEAGLLVLNRDQLFQCYLSGINADLESIIGHLTILTSK